MKLNLTMGNWVLCGDRNMTDLFDDVVGPSAFIHGSELRAWDALVDNLDLVDNYLCIGVRLGPYYTRHARKTDRYDQSRLDRNYSSNHNDWCQYTREIA